MWSSIEMGNYNNRNNFYSFPPSTYNRDLSMRMAIAKHTSQPNKNFMRGAPPTSRPSVTHAPNPGSKEQVRLQQQRVNQQRQQSARSQKAASDQRALDAKRAKEASAKKAANAKLAAQKASVAKAANVAEMNKDINKALVGGMVEKDIVWMVNNNRPGFNINKINPKTGETPLQSALRLGKPKVVLCLLEKDASLRMNSLAGTQTNVYLKNSPMNSADKALIRKKFDQVLKSNIHQAIAGNLLGTPHIMDRIDNNTRGFNINTPGENGQTPIQAALYYGRPGVVKAFLVRDADISIIDAQGRDTMWYAQNTVDPKVRDELVNMVQNHINHQARLAARAQDAALASSGTINSSSSLSVDPNREEVLGYATSTTVDNNSNTQRVEGCNLNVTTIVNTAFNAGIEEYAWSTIRGFGRPNVAEVTVATGEAIHTGHQRASAEQQLCRQSHSDDQIIRENALREIAEIRPVTIQAPNLNNISFLPRPEELTPQFCALSESADRVGGLIQHTAITSAIAGGMIGGLPGIGSGFFGGAATGAIGGLLRESVVQYQCSKLGL